jgi:hypothetical protein
MLPVQTIAASVLAGIVRRQPASKERTAFAWSVVAGPALGRAATVDLRDGVLLVSPKDARWASEIDRARDTLVLRLQALLGPAEVKSLRVVEAPRASHLEPRY